MVIGLWEDLDVLMVVGCREGGLLSVGGMGLLRGIVGGGGEGGAW